jgi:hypothetical protein
MRSVVARARSMRNNAHLIDRHYPSRTRRPVFGETRSIGRSRRHLPRLRRFLRCSSGRRSRLGHFALLRHRKSIGFGYPGFFRRRSSGFLLHLGSPGAFPSRFPSAPVREVIGGRGRGKARGVQSMARTWRNVRGETASWHSGCANASPYSLP